MKSYFIKQILIFAVLILIYIATYYAMYHFRVMEAIMAPGSSNNLPLKIRFSMFFLILKFFMIFIAPGLFLASLFMRFTLTDSLKK